MCRNRQLGGGRGVFRHLHALDLSFHLNRQTGALTRVLDRGSRSISFVMSALVFNVVPTFLELGIVCGILTHQLGGQYAMCCIGTIGTCCMDLRHHTMAHTIPYSNERIGERGK